MTNNLLEDIEIRDWRIMPNGGLDEIDVEKEERARFLLSAKFDPHAGCLWVTVQDANRTDYAAEVMIEINKGVPCLHIGNQHLGDSLVHVFVSPDGVSIVGDGDTQRFQEIDSSRFYDIGRSPAVHYENQV